ncbi:MAG: DMT family transporter [Bacilli bacterium]
MKNKNISLVLALIATLIGASANALSKMGLEGFSAVPMALLRHFFTALFFFLLAIFSKMRLPKLKDVPWFFLTGFTGFAFFSFLFNLGLETTNVAMASIILGTFPIMTIILAAIIFKEKIALGSYFAVAIEFIGIIVLFANKGTFTVSIGAVLIFLSALMLAIYNVTQKHLLKKYRPIEIITYSIITCLLMMSMYIPKAISEIKVAPSEALWAVIILGIVASGVTTILWSIAVSKATSVTTITNFAFLTPFLAIIYGLILVPETLEVKTIIGGLVIIGGSIMFQYFNNRQVLKQPLTSFKDVSEDSDANKNI